MNLPRRAFGVPLHPLLVHFPIALWLLLPLLDLAILFAGPDPWWMLAQIAVLTGLVIGALAMLVGLAEYRDPLLAGIDMRLAARHGIRTSLAWCMFAARAILAALLPVSQGIVILYLVLDLFGCVLLSQGIVFGTRQVYQRLQR